MQKKKKTSNVHRTAWSLKLAAHPDNVCYENGEQVGTNIACTWSIAINFKESFFPCINLFSLFSLTCDWLFQELFSRISELLYQKASSLQDLSSVQEPSTTSGINIKKIETGKFSHHCHYFLIYIWDFKHQNLFWILDELVHHSFFFPDIVTKQKRKKNVTV